MWESHSTFQNLKGLTGELERDSSSGTKMIGQGAAGTNGKRGNLDIRKKLFAFKGGEVLEQGDGGCLIPGSVGVGLGLEQP